MCLLRDQGTSEDPGFKSSCFILLAQIACKCSWCSTCYLFFAGGTTNEYPCAFTECETSSKLWKLNSKFQSYLHWEFFWSIIILDMAKVFFLVYNINFPKSLMVLIHCLKHCHPLKTYFAITNYTEENAPQNLEWCRWHYGTYICI